LANLFEYLVMGCVDRNSPLRDVAGSQDSNAKFDEQAGGTSNGNEALLGLLDRLGDATRDANNLLRVISGCAICAYDGVNAL